MIVVDTSVVVELMRSAPDAAVTEWARAEEDSLVLTSITLAEIESAVRKVPGMRRVAVGSMWAGVRKLLAGHVLAFDEAAAVRYGELLAHPDAPSSVFDAQTAAICRVHDARLATGDPAPFTGTGLVLVDPWRGPTRR